MSEPLTPEQVREALEICTYFIEEHGWTGRHEECATTLRRLLESGLVTAAMCEKSPTWLDDLFTAYRRLQGENRIAERCQCNDPGCAGTTDHPFGPGVQCHNEADVLVEVHRLRGGSGDPEVDEEAEVALCCACLQWRNHGHS